MTFELLFAVTAIGVLGVLSYIAGRHLGATVAKGRPWLFVETLGLSLLFAWTMAHDLVWASALPVADIVCWSNVLPILLAFTAGLASRTPGLRGPFRAAAVGLFVLMALGHLVTPVARPVLWPIPDVQCEGWSNGVCLQSHEATCAAAAAASLLSRHEIISDEREMIDQCLTSLHGTSPLGLYRGLSTVADKHDHVAKVANADPLMWSENKQLPNVALITLAHGETQRGVTQLLGPRGEGHAVVVLAREDGQWVIGDPAIGLLRWSDEQFRSRFTGDAVFLSRR
ncbi:cysteine peptidase family C39 domain-containing protein [Stieleria varia]|uniref:Peptidase C39 family protein n=1 Tax=Stieleria varia TaxID=2528005 RepID=A0A5C6ATK2_9BACT|nr:cysteine peptidase family C39 domain-containing protein [Stieleria varia]TWU02787.1 Peptidase C39 family protein [Stieleria varia]